MLQQECTRRLPIWFQMIRRRVCTRTFDRRNTRVVNGVARTRQTHYSWTCSVRQFYILFKTFYFLFFILFLFISFSDSATTLPIFEDVRRETHSAAAALIEEEPREPAAAAVATHASYFPRYFGKWWYIEEPPARTGTARTKPTSRKIEKKCEPSRDVTRADEKNNRIFGNAREHAAPLSPHTTVRLLLRSCIRSLLFFLFYYH